MNKYVRATICVPCGMIKMLGTKLFHFSSFSGPLFCLVSPYSEITMDRGSKLIIGKQFKMRDGAKIRVRQGAICHIGNNSSINSNNMIACHERIEIGSNVQFSPNVQIYDHDHDYKTEGGIKTGKYTTAPIVIGNNVWIGSNSVVLKGTTIGDNCVIGAGSVINGDIPSNTVVVQKRVTMIKEVE